MDILLAVTCMIMGFFVGTFVNAQLLLPLLYGVPISVYYFIAGKIKFSAVIFQLITPLIWAIGLIILGFIFSFIYPPINTFLTTNSGWLLGNLFSIIVIFFNILTSKGRADMWEDYYTNTYQRFSINKST